MVALGSIVEVALLQRLPRSAQVFDYELPASWRCAAGDLVTVPFRRSVATGVVVALKRSTDVGKGLKLVQGVVATGFVNTVQLKLTQRLAHHYGVAWGAALKLAVPFLPNRRFVPAKSMPSARTSSQKVAAPPLVMVFSSAPERLKAAQALVARVVQRDQQVLVLVPELVYLRAWQTNLSKDYRLAVYSAEAKLTEQRQAWAAVRTGEAQVVIGTRAALFLPFQSLGGMVVDYAESESYKQSEQNPRYDGLEVAQWLSELAQASLAYLSPAPPLALWQHTAVGAMRWKSLAPSRAIPFELVDLTEERRSGNRSLVSHTLAERVSQSLARGEKVFLYLNRRGSATAVTCRDCGFTAACPTCGRTLVWSASANQLACYHCGLSQTMLLPCPRCGGTNLRYLGAGLEGVERELKALWPAVKMVTLEGDVSVPPPHLDQVPLVLGSRTAFRYLDFTRVGLVAALLPDTELSLPEYRAAEGVWSTLRFFLTSGAGRVLAQTFRPEHYLWRSLQPKVMMDFYQAELVARQPYSYPPLSQLVRFTAEGNNERDALAQARSLVQELKPHLDAGAAITGPYPDYYRQVRGRYRFHLLLRYPQTFNPELLWPFLPDGILIDRHPWNVLR